MNVLNTFLIGILLSIVSLSSYSQCAVTSIASSTTICLGDSVQLFASGGCGVLMNNDFNNQTVGAGWSSNASPMFNNPCGPGLPGSLTHCWIGSATDFPRSLETIPFTLISGCSISFEMRYAADENDIDCEDPDLTDEGVHLQYSLPPYSGWTDFIYWTPNSTQSGPLYTWNQYLVNIPAAAFSTATKIRWYQNVTSGNEFDHWGIDEIEITCPISTSVVWSHGPTVLNPPMVYPTHDTSYIVTVYDSINGYSASDTLFINVLPVPTSDFTVTSPICTDNFSTLMYSGTGSSASTFNWLFSGATVLSGSGAGPYNLQWPTGGTMWVSLEVTDSGCTSPATYDTVVVHQAPTASFTADIQEGCQPLPVHFTDLSNPAGSVWQWNFGDMGTSLVQNPTHTYTSAGLFDVSLIVTTAQGCDDTVTYQNYINVFNQPVANITATPQITSIVNPEITFGSSSSGVSDWFWDFGDGTTSASAPSVIHEYTNDGLFNVSLIVTSADGCSDSALITVQIIAEPHFYNVITPDGNGMNDVFVIENAERIPGNLQIFNRWGKKIWESSGESYMNNFDGENFSDGTYYYIYTYGVEMENEYQGTLTIMR